MAVSAATTAIGNKINAGKNKVIDVTSDILSAPKRAYYGAKMKQANRDYDTIKEARKYPASAASFDASGAPTQALKARTARDEVAMRRK